MFERWGGLAVFFSRFLLTPLAIPINLLAGGTRYALWRYLGLVVAGEALWVVTFGGMGYLFADQWEAVSALMGNLSGAVAAAALGLTGAGYLLRRAWLGRRDLRFAIQGIRPARGGRASASAAESTTRGILNGEVPGWLGCQVNAKYNQQQSGVVGRPNGGESTCRKRSWWLTTKPACAPLSAITSPKKASRVVVAENGHDALYVARHERPDLILLDVMMPDLDGYEFLRAYRKGRNMPVILLTAKRGQGRQGGRPGARGRRLCDQAVRNAGTGRPDPRGAAAPGQDTAPDEVLRAADLALDRGSRSGSGRRATGPAHPLGVRAAGRADRFARARLLP